MEKREITCLFGTILGGGNLISVADILFTIYVYFRKKRIEISEKITYFFNLKQVQVIGNRNFEGYE